MAAQGALMLFERRVIAARSGAGPCGARAMLFKVAEHLAHQWQQRLHGSWARKSKLDERLRGGFSQCQRVTGYERPGRVIGRLAAARNRHRSAAERTSDCGSGAAGARMAFDGEDHTFKIRLR